jgi:PAS domain S-box-containing protein
LQYTKVRDRNLTSKPTIMHPVENIRKTKTSPPALSYTADEDYSRQIVNIANVAVVKFDKKLRLTEYAGNAESIFGFTREEVIGKSLEETIVPRFESTGRNLDHLIHHLIQNTGKHEYNINENITKDGRRIWMQWHNSEIRDEKNRLTEILSFGMDITSLIETEIALRESEERFRKLSDLTFEGILIHDNGIIIDCNLSFERQIGYSREKLIGQNLFDLLIPAKWHSTMREKFSNETAQYETEAIHQNGTLIPVSIDSRKVKIAGKVVRVAAIRNISDLKKTIHELDIYKNHLEELVAARTKEIKQQSRILEKQNEMLEFERNQLRTIIDNIPDLVYIKDRESRFLNANKYLIRHLGKRELNDITGKTDFDFYDINYAEKYYNDERKILKTGKPVIGIEEPTVNELGKKLYLLTTKVPLRDKKKRITSIVGIGRDITEKKHAENRLKESHNKLEKANRSLHKQKAKIEATLYQLKNTQAQLVQSEKMASLGILTAGIAHEVNNPVNFVYAGVNSLMKDFKDVMQVMEEIRSLNGNFADPDAFFRRIEELKKQYDFETACSAIGETLNDIKIGAGRISEIVAGLSRFSRIESEKWKLADLHEEIDSVLVLLKNKYKHNIEVVKKYDPELPKTECHPGKMNQAFMNIINNAIDAIEGCPGTITITTGVSAGSVNISIHDTGKGIRDNDKTRIFDPFFTTKEAGYGLGLGLSITYSIIREHNGKISVKSGEGKGTTFTIHIPALQS